MGRHMVGASQRLAGRPIPSEFGSALKIKRRGGVLLGEHRGGGYCVWPLYMKSDRKPFWFPFSQQTGSLLASYQTKRIQNISTLSYIPT